MAEGTKSVVQDRVQDESIAPFPAVFYPSLFPSIGQINAAITGLVIFLTVDETSRCQLTYRKFLKFRL